MTITVSEDLNVSPRNDFRFCATVDADTDPERGGFGRTEMAALAMLIEQFPKSRRAALAGATVERMAVR